MSARKPCRRPEIPWRVIEEEAVVVNPRTGLVYPLNPVGTRCWELADGSRTLSDIVEVICEEFEAPRESIERDVEAFILGMQEKQLIEVTEATAEELANG